jgi:poly(hydroxyalkanoate) depolymerase family esterase
MKLNEGFMNSMHKVMALLRNGNPTEATEAIQRALRGEEIADVASEAHADVQVQERPATATETSTATARAKAFTRAPAPADLEVEDRGHFTTHSYANAAGLRQYRLYVPAGYRSEPLPLVVMLHGCTQDADDFAAGTQMNALAEKHNCIVAYPIQPQHANPSKCWNWFKPGDQEHDKGEPSLIAGITREVMASHRVDPDRVYIAGLSAGGAMAAIMVRAYPELYAAAGVHSGLAHGCAHDLPSALAAMRGGKRKGAKARRGGLDGALAEAPKRPLIVFHGDADKTVHPSNAMDLVRGFGLEASSQNHAPAAAPGHRMCNVKRLKSEHGVDAELWTIHGAPHAWAGGSPRGTYTDASGPNASAEMMRFFLAHPRRVH